MLLKNNSAFRNLFIGRILSVFADSIMFFSLLKLIEIQSTNNASYTLFFVAYYLPVTLLALPIGAWIGNRTLQKVMSVSNTLRVVMLVFFLIATPYVSYYWVYFLLIILSILGLFFIPANQSLLPHIVKPEHRPTANSLLQLGFTVVKIVGQVFTAFMIKLSVSPAILLMVSAACIALSIIFINQIKPYKKQDQLIKQSHWVLTKEGVSYIHTHPQLKILFVFLAAEMFIATSVDLILLSYLTDVLHIGVENLSFIGTASLLGIMIGATITPKLYRKIERKWLLIPPLFISCLSIGSLIFITNLLYILPFFFIGGTALGCFNVTFITYLQDVVSSENYTRTFSLYNMITSSVALPGVLFMGVLLSRIGVIHTIFFLTGLMFLIGIVGIYIIPNLGKGITNQITLEKAI